jgi:hypothetical protein
MLDLARRAAENIPQSQASADAEPARTSGRRTRASEVRVALAQPTKLDLPWNTPAGEKEGQNLCSDTPLKQPSEKSLDIRQRSAESEELC